MRGEYLEDIPIHLGHPQLEPDVGALPGLQYPQSSLHGPCCELLINTVSQAAPHQNVRFKAVCVSSRKSKGGNVHTLPSSTGQNCALATASDLV